MASLARVCRGGAKLLADKYSISALSTRCYAYWNKDWQPGPYPTTEKEKVAAAKKYGLRRDDYEPYPDDGFGHGDYPNLPRVSDEGKDKYYNWDLLHVRRNYGEPMHVDADAMTADRWNPNEVRRYSMAQMRWFAFLIFGTIIGAYALVDDFPVFRPVIPKQMPNDGRQHYDFASTKQ